MSQSASDWGTKRIVLSERNVLEVEEMSESMSP
jgi:hypothetical protein